MTILSALTMRHRRLVAEGGAPPPGFAPARMAFCLVIDARGDVVTIDDLRVAKAGWLRPLTISAPEAPRRSSGVVSGAFWDKTSYVLGRAVAKPGSPTTDEGFTSRRAWEEHAAFRARHEALLGGLDDPGCNALLSFLRAWRPQMYDLLPHAPEMLGANVCFRFYADSGFIHDRPAARTAVEGAPGLTQGGDRAQCLVTGEIGSVVRLHSLVRGVPGTLPTGAALVSFNLPSSFSYGKSQGEIAPVSSQAALAYSAALADLLASTKALDGSDEARWSNRAQLGDTTVLFWADADDRAVGDEAEAVVAALLGLPDGVPGSGPSALMAAQAALRDFHAALPDGLAGGGRPARFHILGLRPNVARLSVRFWFENSLGEIATSFEELWGDLRLEPAPARLAPSIRDLLLELAPLRRAESIPTHLSGALMRSILSGAPFPKTLLVQALMRVRAERSTTPLRTALIKACLARDARQGLSDEGVPVSLSRDEPNVGYRLGRLFAVLDAAQRAGVGRVNLRLADKFFGSASVTPARVFPLLLKGARIHLTAAKRHGSAGRAVVLDQEISRILAGLPADAPFPPILRLADQGRFVVGFYHETAEIWTRGAFGRLTDQPGAQDVTA